MSPRKPSATAAAADPGWLRARRPEHKQERREAILSAARALLDAEGVEGASLSAIARESGLSKANLYRYFESREAILLSVVLDETRDWDRAVTAELAALAGSDDADAVASVFARCSAERPRLCMLVSALWSVLERNVSLETVADFKRNVHEVMFGSAEAVAAALPGISSDEARAFLSFFFVFAAGAWGASNPAPVVAELYTDDEFAGMQVDFETALEAHARILLHGLLTTHA